MEVSKVFYRYYRPLGIRSTHETFTRSDGGVCLRFEQLPEGDLFFTAAICHPEDTFSKAVSKKITDTRAQHILKPENHQLLALHRGIPWSQDAFQLAQQVSALCQKNAFPGQVDIASVMYQRWHLKQVGETITELLRQNIQLTVVSEALLKAHLQAAKPYYQEKACGT